MRCAVCGSSETEIHARARDWEYRTSDDSFRYDHCRGCGCLFLNPPLTHRLGEIYPPNYYSYQSPEERLSIGERVKRKLDERLFKRLLEQLDGDRLRVLDVGGGTGWMLSVIRELSPRIAETHEVDLDPRARERAEADGHVFHECPVEDFSSAEPFDLIIMLNLIEHVANPLAVLRSMRALMAPQALLLIKTPNVRTLDARWFRDNGVNIAPPEMPGGPNILHERLAQTLVDLSLPSLLRYADRNSMAYSVESRLPFLTPALVEFVLSLPEDYIIACDGTTKAVFRRAMRGIVPDAILDRRDKIGFRTPEAGWLGELRVWVQDVLNSDVASTVLPLNLDAAKRNFEDVTAGQTPPDTSIWRCVNLIRWAEIFDVSFAV